MFMAIKTTQHNTELEESQKAQFKTMNWMQQNKGD